MRVVIFSHGHPTFSKGGAEIAAYNLHKGINATGEHQSWFVARVPDNLLNPNTVLSSLSENEYLIGGTADFFTLNATIPLGSDSEFASFLRSIDPDVVHFHHYLYFGVDMFRAVKRIVPRARIILTLHEYAAICSHFGQMVKTDGRLCYRASPRECSECFPNRRAEDFFLRERYIKGHFDIVDHFISPSHFLKQRYVDWGLAAERVSVIENGLPVGDRIPLRQLAENGRRTRFAYFGQINPFKGVDLVIDAFAKLPKEVKAEVTLDIYGSGLEWQKSEFKDHFKTLLKENKKFIKYHGPYEPEEMGGLLENVDWMVMGSIWWENSPVVIQEAFKFGRPIICPDIGGMSEKVVDERNGRLYRARDPLSLARVISELVACSQEDYAAYIAANEYVSISQAAASHLRLFSSKHLSN